MTSTPTVVHGFEVGRAALTLAGGAAVINAGLVFAGIGQDPKSAPEKVGTAIARGAILGTTTALTKRPFMRTILLGALAGDMAGNLASASVRGDDKDAPIPRPGNWWSDITDAVRKDAKSVAKRNAILLGSVGAVAGGVAGRIITKSWGSTVRWAAIGGGAGAGVGAATGALDGAWRGVYQGTGIALGRAIDQR